MDTNSKTQITITATIKAPINQVWAMYNDPYHITKWNSASEDWHCPQAESDFREGGKFSSRMEAKDGSMGFDFWGIYQKIQVNKLLSYEIGDGRKASVFFEEIENESRVTIQFEAEGTNSLEMQQAGWQAILDNFKNYVEFLQTEFFHMEIEILASPAQVFDKMFSHDSYREWTSIFSPGSYFEGTLNKGERIYFLTTNEKGQREGMIGTIADLVPDYHCSFKFIGLVNDGKEIEEGEEIDNLKGSFENYTLVDHTNKTILKIDMGPGGDYKDYFEKTWPKALHKLKTICES